MVRAEFGDLNGVRILRSCGGRWGRGSLSGGVSNESLPERAEQGGRPFCPGGFVMVRGTQQRGPLESSGPRMRWVGLALVEGPGGNLFAAAEGAGGHLLAVTADGRRNRDLLHLSPPSLKGFGVDCSATAAQLSLCPHIGQTLKVPG